MPNVFRLTPILHRSLPVWPLLSADCLFLKNFYLVFVLTCVTAAYTSKMEAAAAAQSAAGTDQSVLFQLFLLDTNFVMSLFQRGLQT